MVNKWHLIITVCLVIKVSCVGIKMSEEIPEYTHTHTHTFMMPKNLFMNCYKKGNFSQ